MATGDENSQYRALEGTLMYLGNGTLPQAAFYTSLMQQKLGRLKVAHIVDGKNLLNELLKLKSWVTFRPSEPGSEATVTKFAGESHGGRESSYGQMGVITGLMMLEKGSKNRRYHHR